MYSPSSNYNSLRICEHKKCGCSPVFSSESTPRVSFKLWDEMKEKSLAISKETVTVIKTLTPWRRYKCTQDLWRIKDNNKRVAKQSLRFVHDIRLEQFLRASANVGKSKQFASWAKKREIYINTFFVCIVYLSKVLTSLSVVLTNRTVSFSF